MNRLKRINEEGYVERRIETYRIGRNKKSKIMKSVEEI
jgi:hypothetical protein